jgi:hypothetical protein
MCEKQPCCVPGPCCFLEHQENSGRGIANLSFQYSEQQQPGPEKRQEEIKVSGLTLKVPQRYYFRFRVIRNGAVSVTVNTPEHRNNYHFPPLPTPYFTPSCIFTLYPIPPHPTVTTGIRTQLSSLQISVYLLGSTKTELLSGTRSTIRKTSFY